MSVGKYKSIRSITKTSLASHCLPVTQCKWKCIRASNIFIVSERFTLWGKKRTKTSLIIELHTLNFKVQIALVFPTDTGHWPVLFVLETEQPCDIIVASLILFFFMFWLGLWVILDIRMQSLKFVPTHTVGSLALQVKICLWLYLNAVIIDRM